MSELPYRSALVTGAARRIGAAIATDLAADGWAVAIHYNSSADDAAKLAQDITAEGGKAVALQGDLAHEEVVAGLVGRATEALGPLTCLVNNASVFENDAPETVTRESWDLHMEVNLRAPFVLTQAFARQIPDGIEGNVVNILDQRVWNFTPFFTTYTLSKAGLWTLTRTLAMALAPRVRVNAIGPGPTLPSARQTDEQFIRQWASLPLGRAVMPDEIVDALHFILDAPSVTGQMIAVDGGQHMGWKRDEPMLDE